VGYFYIDESIHERAGFILGSYVYSQRDLTPYVFQKLTTVGLTAGKDEFKSSAKMSADPTQRSLRENLKDLLGNVKLGLVVVPTSERSSLGSEALKGLSKILHANALTAGPHQVYFDEGITFQDRLGLVDQLGLTNMCEIHVDRDSRLVGGLQMADLAAHTMSTMLLETLGIISKTVKAGPNSGYDPDLDIDLGFQMWATLRYHFFTMDKIDLDADPIEGFTLDTGSYAVHVAESCPEELRKAVQERFGRCYMGCIH